MGLGISIIALYVSVALCVALALGSIGSEVTFRKIVKLFPIGMLWLPLAIWAAATAIKRRA